MTAYTDAFIKFSNEWRIVQKFIGAYEKFYDASIPSRGGGTREESSPTDPIRRKIPIEHTIKSSHIKSSIKRTRRTHVRIPPRQRVMTRRTCKNLSPQNGTFDTYCNIYLNRIGHLIRTVTESSVCKKISPQGLEPWSTG